MLYLTKEAKLIYKEYTEPDDAVDEIITNPPSPQPLKKALYSTS